MEWLWYFVIYSFLGCLLELLFARITGERHDRKRSLLIPLCPVYGVGACAVLRIAPLAKGGGLGLFVLGGIVCTAVEYLFALWYEYIIGVPFWDYGGLAGNLHGRVCLFFSAVWGLLALAGYSFLHPLVVRLVAWIPLSVTVAIIPSVFVDLIFSGILLHQMGNRACLRWYHAFPSRFRKRGENLEKSSFVPVHRFRAPNQIPTMKREGEIPPPFQILK